MRNVGGDPTRSERPAGRPAQSQQSQHPQRPQHPQDVRSRLLTLQRTAGNRAVARMVSTTAQRPPAAQGSPAADPHQHPAAGTGGSPVATGALLQRATFGGVAMAPVNWGLRQATKPYWWGVKGGRRIKRTWNKFKAEKAQKDYAAGKINEAQFDAIMAEAEAGIDETWDLPAAQHGSVQI